MNILVRFAPLILIFTITNATQAGTQTVQATRNEYYGRIRPMMNNYVNIIVTSGGKKETYVTGTIGAIPNAAGIRSTLMALSGRGVPQSGEPYCIPKEPRTYSDSTGDYKLSCRTLVQYRNTSDFQSYDPRNQTDIVAIAVDTTWTKNGVEINPTMTDVPKFLGDGYKLYLYSDDGLKNYEFTFQGRWDNNDTVLTFNIDDVVYGTGDDAIINYSWVVTPGFPFISAMNANMYMEQIDSNIAMSYVKPDGTGAAEIVPYTKINLEDISKGLTSNGQIKLKLDGKNAFGTLSSQLRVTVEWQ